MNLDLIFLKEQKKWFESWVQIADGNEEIFIYAKFQFHEKKIFLLREIEIPRNSFSREIEIPK